MDVITLREPKSPIAEAYRTLRTNIRFASFEKEIKTIAITSSWIDEGKSTVTTNLGITMAQSGSKILIIDGDLRNPTIHKGLFLSNSMGITNILSDSLPYKEYIVSYPKVDNLDVLLCGPKPPNPSELLGSAKMRNLLEGLKTDYDYILIDTPPITVVTDAALVASACDGVILVVESGKTVINNAVKAKELLQNVNANILGVVLNKMKIEKPIEYYSYNYYSIGLDKSKKSNSHIRRKRR